MHIPNADLALVERAKLHAYLLSLAHPVGRFKAAFFLALGYSPETWEQLEVVSVWVVRRGEDFPRFVTAYPGGSE
ncbi:MAG: DUF6883 domain-containing protein [Candidatus Rokuibacteriota bacterium]